MGRALLGGGGAKPTRVTQMNPRLFQTNDVQKKMAHDHDQYFSVPFPDYILESSPITSMLQTAQNVAEVYGLTRKELDDYSAESHRKTHAAFGAGTYKDEVLALEVEEPVFDDQRNWVEEETGKTVTFDRDEGIRPDTTPEKLSQLPPIKGVVSLGDKEIVITAGNSCPTNDGVSAALLMSEEMAVRLGLEPLARIAGLGVGGVKPQLMGIGPIVSTRKALVHAGLDAGKIDRVGVNEAFAAQGIPSVRELGIQIGRASCRGRV